MTTSTMHLISILGHNMFLRIDKQLDQWVFSTQLSTPFPNYRSSSQLSWFSVPSQVTVINTDAELWKWAISWTAKWPVRPKWQRLIYLHETALPWKMLFCGISEEVHGDLTNIIFFSYKDYGNERVHLESKEDLWQWSLHVIARST